ncbi:GAF domain-containing protein [Actinotalea ferrariae]|uniref:GAF domain-containing protein n=1 Tax=Actinotalea ferrariae TaxID=1386098 RepID=UPI0012DD85AB|nr:GAF domain-containing protein [Actinotalea ferrariae]
MAAVLFADITVARGAVGSVVLGLAALPEIAAAWWRHEEEKANGNAVAEAQVLLGQALTPLADLTASLAQGEANPNGIFARACQHAAASCLVPFRDRLDVRALVFAVSEDQQSMTCVAHSGRLPKSEGFRQGTTRGNSAFKVLFGGEPVHVDDIAEERLRSPRAWMGSGNGYDTFITAPIAVGEKGYGLLTVDAPGPGAFSRTDVLLVQLVASMLAGLFAEYANRRREGAESDG